MPDRSHDAPYRQIAGYVRQAITDGRLKPGEKVPSVRELQREYEVAHATAHRALTLLQAEGFVQLRQGRAGSVVTSEEERSRSAAEHAEKAKRTGRIYPEGQYAVVTDTGYARASKEVAAALGVRTGSRVIYRSRTRYAADDRPSAISTSWFPADLGTQAPKLLQRERLLEGTFAYIASVTGKTVTGGQDQVWAVLATPEVAAGLQVDAGDPVVAGRNWFLDSEGHTVEYGESYTVGRLTGRWGSAIGE